MRVTRFNKEYFQYTDEELRDIIQELTLAEKVLLEMEFEKSAKPVGAALKGFLREKEWRMIRSLGDIDPN